jgi:hypothetical protein
MRAHAAVLQITLLVALPALPGGVDAQQHKADPPATTEGAAQAATPKPVPRRSLMGTVMATLIEGAEQSRHREATPAAKPPIPAGAPTPAEPVPADPAPGPQVAAQTPP